MPVSDGGATSAAGSSNMMMMLFPILLIVVFIVLIIVPNKRKKQFKNMLGNLRVGDMIKTIGGFYGKVVMIKEDLVTIECGRTRRSWCFRRGRSLLWESFEEGKEIPEKTDAKKDDAKDSSEKTSKKGNNLSFGMLCGTIHG